MVANFNTKSFISFIFYIFFVKEVFLKLLEYSFVEADFINLYDNWWIPRYCWYSLNHCYNCICNKERDYCLWIFLPYSLCFSQHIRYATPSNSSWALALAVFVGSSVAAYQVRDRSVPYFQCLAVNHASTTMFHCIDKVD